MKKLLVTFISFMLFMNISLASTNTYPRTEDDMGVNKTFSSQYDKNAVLDTPRVDASEKIYDFADVLTEEEENRLYNDIISYINHTNMDMVILTINSELSDWQIQNYALDFYDYNDFGISFPKYSGLILVRNVNSYNRFFNIYTTGEARIYYTNDICDDILDDIYDDLKNDNYPEGFSRFISLSKEYYEKGPAEDAYVDENGNVHYSFHAPWGTAVIISGIITAIIMIILIKKNKMIKKETLAGVYINRGSIKFNNQIDQFMHSHTTSYTVSHNSGGGSSGGSSGGSFSGSSGMSHGGGSGRHG